MTREEREEALDVLTDMANALHLIPTTRQGKVFKMVLQELQKPEQKWIPVNSGILPKGYERVLVTRRMFHWANEPVEYTVGIESFSGNVDFVAWMPLPEPYKASPTGAESEDKE